MTREQEKILLRSLLLMKYSNKKTFSENFQEVAGDLLLELNKPQNNSIKQNAWDFIQSEIKYPAADLGVTSQVASELLRVGWTDAQEDEIKKDKDTLVDILDAKVTVTTQESKIVEDILKKYSKKYIMFDTKETDRQNREIYVAYPAMEYLRAIYAEDEYGDNLRADLWAAPGFINDIWKKRVTEIFQNSFIDWIEETNRIKNSIIYSKGITVTACKDKNKQYYEDGEGRGRCVVSEKRYYEITPGSKFGNSEYDFPWVPVNNESDVYSLYALWFFWSVNDFTWKGWQYSPKGKCFKATKNIGTPYSEESVNEPTAFTCNAFKNDGKLFLQNLMTSENPCVCYNDTMASQTPWQNLNLKDINSTAGRLDKSSLYRYNGFIPSYAEILKTFGTTDLSYIIKYLDETKRLWVNKTGSKEQYKENTPNTGDLNFDVHDWLMLAQIATFFIPVAGPWISLGLNVLDAGIYANEGDYQTAALVFGLGLAFDIPGIGDTLKQFGKGGIKALTVDELENVAKSVINGDIDNLSPKQLEFIREYMKLDRAGKLKPGLEDLAAKYSDDALESNTKNPTLKTNEKEALEQYSKKQSKIGVATNPVTKGGPITSVGTAISVIGAVGMGYDIYKQASDPFRYNIENLPQVINKWFKGEYKKSTCGENCYKPIFDYFGVTEPYKTEIKQDVNYGLDFKGFEYTLPYVNLSKLWTEGWRPINKRTGKPNSVPEEYQTEVYKKRVEEETIKILEDLEKQTGEAVEQELQKSEGYKKAREKSKKESEKLNKQTIERTDYGFKFDPNED